MCGECADCPCPNETWSSSTNSCVGPTCSSGKFFDTSTCACTSCSTVGMVWNGTTCVCPANTGWNGSACVTSCGQTTLPVSDAWAQDPGNGSAIFQPTLQGEIGTGTCVFGSGSAVANCLTGGTSSAPTGTWSTATGTCCASGYVFSSDLGYCVVAGCPATNGTSNGIPYCIPPGAPDTTISNICGCLNSFDNRLCSVGIGNCPTGASAYCPAAGGAWQISGTCHNSCNWSGWGHPVCIIGYPSENCPLPLPPFSTPGWVYGVYPNGTTNNGPWNGAPPTQAIYCNSGSQVCTAQVTASYVASIANCYVASIANCLTTTGCTCPAGTQPIEYAYNPAYNPCPSIESFYACLPTNPTTNCPD
jgi:hypothetical protein